MRLEQAMRAAGTQLAAETLEIVLAQENAALARMDFRAVGALGATKAAAVAGFAAAARDAAGLGQEAGARLSALADQNRALLERALAAPQEVVATVVALARQGGDRYTARGTRAGETRAMAMSARV